MARVSFPPVPDVADAFSTWAKLTARAYLCPSLFSVSFGAAARPQVFKQSTENVVYRDQLAT
ncbi:MAG: hypothetical protein ACHQ03_11530 [Candidatus Bathyarchaeia archaeon]